jgi:hypothetical protein
MYKWQRHPLVARSHKCFKCSGTVRTIDFDPRGLALQGIRDTDGGEHLIIINWVYVDMNVIINRFMALDGRNAVSVQPYAFGRIN